MAVVVVPPSLAAVPGGLAAALADVAGTPNVVRVEGDWSGVERLPDARNIIAVTIAVDPPPRLGDAFDLATHHPAKADRWVHGFTRCPEAALAGALLVRRAPADVWAGLVAESTTYSLLQSGAAFRAWLESGDRGGRPADDAGDPRVRLDGRTIVLTRPGRHNALDARMRDQLLVALDDVAATPGPIELRGEGPSFCSGGDLGEFGTLAGPVEAHVLRLTRSLAFRLHQLGDRVTVYLHGSCLGAGIELAAFAGRVVASPSARIGLPELGLGLVPGAGGTVSIPRRVGRQRLLDLLLTGRTIDTATAVAWGLVDEVVEVADAPT